MWPEVRYLILADTVSASPNNLLRVNIQGLLTHVRARGGRFPLTHPLFNALLVLTKCTGPGDLSLRVVYDPTAHVVFRLAPRPVRFTGPADEAVGVVFKVRNCSFPNPGLYFVECLYSGGVIARQALTVLR